MKNITVIALFLILVFPFNVFSQGLSYSSVPAHEEGGYRTLLKKSGEYIWRADWSLDVNTSDESRPAELIENIYGKYNDSKDDIRCVVQSRLFLSKTPRVLGTVQVASSDKDEGIWQKNKIFNYTQKKLIARQFEHGKLVMERSSPFPDGPVFSADVLVAIFQGYDFEKAKPFSFYVYSSEGKLYNVTVRIIGKEKVSVPPGDFDCYKMELRPDLGLLNFVITPFLPKTYLWFTVSKPHLWMKYEGLESGLGTPYVIRELVWFNNGSISIGQR